MYFKLYVYAHLSLSEYKQDKQVDSCNIYSR